MDAILNTLLCLYIGQLGPDLLHIPVCFNTTVKVIDVSDKSIVYGFQGYMLKLSNVSI